MRPLYNRQSAGQSFSGWGTSGVTGRGYAIDLHTQNDGISPDDTTNYYHEDALGSERMMTSVDGYPVWKGTYLPFGDEFNPQMTANNYKFAGMEQDSESGLGHTQFRQYGSTIGRWMTPDALGGDITNPQSLNRYVYALDNPCTLADPAGLSPCDVADTTNAKIINFINANLSAVQPVADQLSLPVQNILGLSGGETRYGTSSQSRVYNNFFNTLGHARHGLPVGRLTG